MASLNEAHQKLLGGDATPPFHPSIHNKADDSPEIAGNYDDFKPTKGEYLLMIQGGGGEGRCPLIPHCHCGGQYHKVQKRTNRHRIKNRHSYSNYNRQIRS